MANFFDLVTAFRFFAGKFMIWDFRPVPKKSLHFDLISKFLKLFQQIFSWISYHFNFLLYTKSGYFSRYTKTLNKIYFNFFKPKTLKSQEEVTIDTNYRQVPRYIVHNELFVYLSCYFYGNLFIGTISLKRFNTVFLRHPTTKAGSKFA